MADNVISVSPTVFQGTPPNDWTEIPHEKLATLGYSLHWRRVSPEAFELNLKDRVTNLSKEIDIKVFPKSGGKKPNHRIFYSYGSYGTYPGQVPHIRGWIKKMPFLVANISAVQMTVK